MASGSRGRGPGRPRRSGRACRSVSSPTGSRGTTRRLSRSATWPSVPPSRRGARFGWTIACPRSRSRWAGPSRWTSRFGIPRERRSPTVEAQHCTFWERSTERFRVCAHVPRRSRRRRPTTCFSDRAGWGSVVINGDYLSLENIAIEQVSGAALKVNPSASGTVLRNVAARAAQVWLEGVNTVAEDLDVSHVDFAGPHRRYLL